MRQVDLEAEREQITFVEKAVVAFEKDKNLATFRTKELKPGALLALRWGFGEDCVVVVRLDPEHEPLNYANVIRQFNEVPAASPPLSPDTSRQEGLVEDVLRRLTMGKIMDTPVIKDVVSELKRCGAFDPKP